jgi:hypothetical protein
MAAAAPPINNKLLHTLIHLHCPCAFGAVAWSSGAAVINLVPINAFYVAVFLVCPNHQSIAVSIRKPNSSISPVLEALT